MEQGHRRLQKQNYLSNIYYLLYAVNHDNDDVAELNSFDPQMFPDSLLYGNKPGYEASKDFAFGLPYLDILPPSIEHCDKLSDIIPLRLPFSRPLFLLHPSSFLPPPSSLLHFFFFLPTTNRWSICLQVAVPRPELLMYRTMNNKAVTTSWIACPMAPCSTFVWLL